MLYNLYSRCYLFSFCVGFDILCSILERGDLVGTRHVFAKGQEYHTLASYQIWIWLFFLWKPHLFVLKVTTFGFCTILDKNYLKMSKTRSWVCCCTLTKCNINPGLNNFEQCQSTSTQMLWIFVQPYVVFCLNYLRLNTYLTFFKSNSCQNYKWQLDEVCYIQLLGGACLVGNQILWVSVTGYCV